MGAAMIQILDSTIANVAIPHMQTSVGATQDTVTWVLTSYIVAGAVVMPITGRRWRCKLINDEMSGFVR